MNNLKWALIGYGDLAERRVAAALQNAIDSELTGIWGRSPEKARDFATRHNIPTAHTTLDELLGSDADAVHVCTPTDSHFEYALAALQAGKHVLVEKPMASTAAECRQLIDTAREKRLTLGVAYYRRAFPKVQRVKQLIESGTLGIPTWANIAAHSWYAPAADDAKHWRVEKSRSGGAGALSDIGVHRLDLLDYWLGPSTVTHASLQNLVQTYEVEDSASIALQLENGAPVHAYFAWNSQTWIDRFEMVGSEGKIIVDPFDGDTITIIRGRDRSEERIEPLQNAHLPCIEDFVSAVRERREPLCGGEAGLRTTQIVDDIISR